MKEEKKIKIDINKRIEMIINEAMIIYVNKVIYGAYETGLEASFQLHFSTILNKLIEIYTLDKDERFQLLLEKNYPIGGQNNYVDIAILYSKGNIEKSYLIELKFKKISHSAPDLGTILSYVDMCNLDRHKHVLKDAADCYFIFLTDLSTYTAIPRKNGTRAELPMHDDAHICKGRSYTVTGTSALRAAKGYSGGFRFNADHIIKYRHFKVKSEDYWYFIEKM